MKIIDIHTHIYPDNIAKKAADSVKEFYEGIGDPTMDGTESMLLDRGGKAGISQYVVLPVAIRPDRVKGINDYIQQRAQANSGFIPFGTVHAAMEGLTDEVDRLLHMGAKGIKMHPDSQCDVPLKKIRFETIYQAFFIFFYRVQVPPVLIKDGIF